MLAVIICNVCTFAILAGLLAGIVVGFIAARVAIADAIAFDAATGIELDTGIRARAAARGLPA